jgi:hypothetical protein
MPGSVAVVAAEVDGLVDRLDELTMVVATMVRDGADDARPGLASLDLMSAAGRLAQAADVLTSLGLIQVSDTGGHCEDAERSAGSWAQCHAGLSQSDVLKSAKVNRCLSRYPLIADAFVRGDLRTFHLAAIDGIIPGRFRNEALAEAIQLVVDVQQELLEVAGTCHSEWEFRRFCKQVRERLDVDGPEPTAGSDDSEISLQRLSTGRWSLFGDLCDRDGAVWATLIEERARLLLLAERDAGAPTSGSEPESVFEKPSWRARNAAAMLSLMLDGAGAKRPGRVGLYVHIDLDDVATRGATVRPKAHTEANYDITIETLWGLLADADITPIFSESGTPLSFGRTQRLAPDILRRVLAHRDLLCGFPSCVSPPTWNQAHHAKDHWEHGGTTDPWCCRGTCRCHHTYHHVDGWGLDPPDDGGPGDFVVTRPDGTAFDPTPRWKTRAHRRERNAVLGRLEADKLAASDAAN